MEYTKAVELNAINFVVFVEVKQGFENNIFVLDYLDVTWVILLEFAKHVEYSRKDDSFIFYFRSAGHQDIL